MAKDERIEKALEAFKKNGFKAEYAENREEAKNRLLELIPEKASVGIPGSRCWVWALKALQNSMMLRPC